MSIYCMPPRWARGRRVLLGLLVPPVLVLGVAACGDDSGDLAGTLSEGSDTEPHSQTTTTDAADADEPDDEDAGAGDDDNDDGGAASDLEPLEGETPEDADLNVEMRHPDGLTIRLKSISFEGNDILLEADIINGTRGQPIVHGNGIYEQQLMRLVDDDGAEYRFVPPEGGSPFILENGESATGTLAFRGPLHTRSDQLRLVTNWWTEDIDEFDIEDGPTSGPGYAPSFVIPFDLTWD